MRKHPKPTEHEFPATLPGGRLAPLGAVLCTEELKRRPSRAPDYETENRTLATLVQALADSPGTILQTLAETMLKVFNVDSAGMSLLTKDGKRFNWAAVAGAWKPHLGAGMPRDFGPCGDVLDCNAPLLFSHWERRYLYLLEVRPLVEEGLLIPFHVGGKAVGTVWVIAHDDRRKFDAEDLRQMEGLGRFASAAYQVVASFEVRDQHRAALNLMEDAVQSRHATEVLNLELSKSEERYRTLFNLGPVAVYSCDAAGVIQNCNRRAVELWGRQPALGDTDEQFCGSFKMFRADGSFMPHEQCPMAEVVSGRLPEVRDAEVLIERPDGTRVTVVVNILPLKNERGEVTGAINCFYDITGRKQAERAAASLAAIVESSDDAIISKDLNSVIASWNKGAERLFGYTAQEAIGHSVTILLPPDRLSEEAEILAQIRRGESVDHFETVRVRKDGSRLEVSLTISPIRDGQGRVIGASKIARDITKRKATDILVDSQRQALQLLAEGAPLEEVLKFLIGVVEHHSAEGMLASVVLLNEAGTHFQRGIGVSLPEAFNASVEGVPVSSPTGLCSAALRRREAVAVHDFNETPWQPFGEFVAPHGLRSGWSVPIISSSGKTLGSFANYYRHVGDPTPQNRELVDMVARTAAIAIERKQAEEALREAGERFRFMAESMPQKMFTAKPNGKVDYFNRQWMEYTGLNFDQMKDGGWTQFIHPEDLAENVDMWQHSIDSGKPFQFEQRFRRADGSYRWHLSRALPMRDADGHSTMWIGSNTDIQTLREQEERLRRTEKMAAAGQLAASMAHEINNPLSSVTNSLYLLENHANLNDEARFFAGTATAELARVTRIVKQSLSYYRVGTVPRDLDLGGIVNESLQIFREKLQRSGIELNARIDEGAELLGFPGELRQVIDNLLLNALEAMPSGGRLSISVRESFDWTYDPGDRKGVRLTIADTGCGVPKDYRRKIFEPFFTTKPEKGTGLGLWILQGIISKHDGVMSLRSSDRAGKSGTIISVFLPSHARAQRKSERSKSEFAA